MEREREREIFLLTPPQFQGKPYFTQDEVDAILTKMDNFWTLQESDAQAVIEHFGFGTESRRSQSAFLGRKKRERQSGPRRGEYRALWVLRYHPIRMNQLERPLNAEHDIGRLSTVIVEPHFGLVGFLEF